MSSVSMRLRAGSALVVLALFPVFVLLVVGLLVAAAVWLAEHATARVGREVLLLSVPLLIAVGLGARDVLRASRPEPQSGEELTRAEHPALWAELDWLAAEMDQPGPDRVVVQPEVNAFVTIAGGQREVMIGYPLLAGMTRLQLRSVLAHEMGHLAHGHVRSVGLAYRAAGLVELTVARLDHSLVRRVVAGYYRLYLLISMSLLRDHERAADGWSARLAGGPEAATAFPELARLDAVWGLLCRNYLPLAGRIEARPALIEAVHELRGAHRAELDDFVAQELAAPTSRWATHPSPAERIRALEAWPAAPAGRAAPPMPGGHEPAWYLLGRQPPTGLDPEVGGSALITIEAGLLPDGSEPAAWADVVQRAVLAQARAKVAATVDQLPVAPGEPGPSLRVLLTALSGGSAATIVAPVLRGDLPVEDRAEATQAVIGSIAAAAVLITLADQDRARVGLRWSGPAEVEYVDHTGVRPWPAQFDLVEPLTITEAYRVLELLQRAGASVDAPLDVQLPARQRALRAVVTGGVPAVRLKPARAGTGYWALYDLLILDDGLLIAPVPGRPYGLGALIASRYARGSLERRGGRRLQALAEAVAGDPVGFAGDPAHQATWLPFAGVRRAKLRGDGGELLRQRLTLTSTEGDTLAVRWSAFSTELGPVEEILRRALDERMLG